MVEIIQNTDYIQTKKKIVFLFQGGYFFSICLS